MFLPMLFIFMIVAFIGELIYQGYKQGDNTNNHNYKNDSYTDNLNYYDNCNMSFRRNNNEDSIVNNQENRDPFKIGQYKNEIDFYDDNMEEFSTFEEAEEYFNDNRE